jgi:putative endonuclease
MTGSYFVYILASRRNGTLYVGVTNDLVRRMSEHKGKLVPGFTRKYGVDQLVYFEQYESVLEARGARTCLEALGPGLEARVDREDEPAMARFDGRACVLSRSGVPDERPAGEPPGAMIRDLGATGAAGTHILLRTFCAGSRISFCSGPAALAALVRDTRSGLIVRLSNRRSRNRSRHPEAGVGFGVRVRRDMTGGAFHEVQQKAGGGDQRRAIATTSRNWLSFIAAILAERGLSTGATGSRLAVARSRLVQELQEQLAHHLGLLLLHPMPGSIHQMKA